MRVLVVDDEEFIRRIVRRALRARGHDVVEASSASDALEQDGTFEAAIIDLHIDARDGVTLARSLMDRDRARRVVFFSGTVDPGRLAEAGAVGRVVRKGDDSVEDLIAAIE